MHGGCSERKLQGVYVRGVGLHGWSVQAWSSKVFLLPFVIVLPMFFSLEPSYPEKEKALQETPSFFWKKKPLPPLLFFTV